MSFFSKIFLVFLLFCNFCFSTDQNLKIFMHDVGQANFVLAVRNDRALVIDCGSSREDWVCSSELNKAKKQRITQSLIGVTEARIVITHNHRDHKNLLPPLHKAMLEIINKNRKAIDQPNLGENDIPILEGWREATRPEELQTNLDLFVGFLADSLGQDVTVEPIRPYVYPTFGPILEHNRNLMVRIIFGNIRLLFPGDADCTLLTHIKNAIKQQGQTNFQPYFNSNLLNGINFILMPHHGSAEHGELLWFNEIHDRISQPLVINNRPAPAYVPPQPLPLLCVISSDPAKQHHLPSEFVPDLDFFPEEVPVQVRQTVLPHSIAVRGRNIANFDKPIFTTCSANAGYYLLVVTPQGEMRMYDGSIYPGAQDLLDWYPLQGGAGGAAAAPPQGQGKE